MIRDDFVIETKSFEYFGEEQGSDSGSIDGFLCRAENYPLSKPMVDHDQKGIKAVGKGEVSDKVTGDLLKGAGARGWNGEKWGPRWMGIDLILLAGGTPANITVDIRGEAWPPKFRGDKLASFENDLLRWVQSSFLSWVHSLDGGRAGVLREIGSAFSEVGEGEGEALVFCWGNGDGALFPVDYWVYCL